MNRYRLSIARSVRCATPQRDIRALSERMLIAVAAKYGKDSYEYEMAGGIRKSERKRPTRRLDSVA